MALYRVCALSVHHGEAVELKKSIKVFVIFPRCSGIPGENVNKTDKFKAVIEEPLCFNGQKSIRVIYSLPNECVKILAYNCSVGKDCKIHISEYCRQRKSVFIFSENRAVENI